MGKHNIYAVILAEAKCYGKNYIDNDTDMKYLSIISAFSFTCAYYNIPVIDLTSRSAEFSDKVSFFFSNVIYSKCT